MHTAVYKGCSTDPFTPSKRRGRGFPTAAGAGDRQEATPTARHVRYPQPSPFVPVYRRFGDENINYPTFLYGYGP